MRQSRIIVKTMLIEQLSGIKPGTRVVAAMSGGVDSSVAAALLQDAGYEVIGVMMQLYPKDLPLVEPAPGGCCSIESSDDARRVTDRMGIPFYLLNFEEVFAKEVIQGFAEEYLVGRTPNPCIVCNQKVKFAALAKKAEALGASYVATGHYVRKERDDATGRYHLYRGVDQRKDQSYVLYGLTQKQLAGAAFPLGGLTKAEVREEARKRGFVTAEKPESQEICFIPDNDYGRFLRDYRPQAICPGEIVDTKGRVLGEHPGVAFFTVGQRKGLGIAAGKPLYVVRIEPDKNRVVVGDQEDCLAHECFVAGLNWFPWNAPPGVVDAAVKIRYTASAVPATIEPQDGGVRVLFHTPQRAVTPGQAAVFYEGDQVLGGGTIQN